MGQALYRKYRSRSFDDVVGQEHITKTLQNALKSGKISHAYLFTGPRGVGKTSVARILAHEINNLAYDDESLHLDIIEIDAASNRRIDEIRELRDKVHNAPTSAKYKVYIIDEVHMLTKEAFNALLKTLEEPPAHCIFILATTEMHKVPDTIISRTQRFSFKPIAKEIAAEHLMELAKKEKLNLTKEAADILAEHGQGSFRDSISLLDQLSTTNGEISADSVRGLLGVPSKRTVVELIEAIKASQAMRAMNLLEQLVEQGIDAAATARELSLQIREQMKSGDIQPWMPVFLRELLGVPASPNPREVLEIAVLEATTSQDRNSNPPDVPRSDRSDGTKASVPKAQKSEIKQREAKQPSWPHKTNFKLDQWQEVTASVKKKAPALYTALKLSRPSLEGTTLILNFQFPLHYKKVNQASQRNLLGEIIEEVTGAPIAIECRVNKELFKEEMSQAVGIKSSGTGRLEAISNIFGTAEVLES